MYYDWALCNPLLSYILLFDSEKGFFPASGIVSGGREELDEVKELG